ncbi:MAG: TldD/PmbA family protein [Clostridia bacterium]
MLKQLFEQAKAKGMGDVEAYITSGESFEVKIHKGEIDGYSSSLSHGLGFRGFHQGKVGYSYTERLSEDSIDILVRHAMENAAINDSDDEDFIFGGSPEYKSVKNYSEEFDKVTEAEKISFARQMEAIALKLDKRIKSSQYCVMGTGKGDVNLVNSRNLDLSDRGNHGYAYIMLLAQDGAKLSSEFDYVMSNDFGMYDAEKLARSAAEKTLAFLDASCMKSGEYPVIIGNEPMAGILGAVSGIFSARAVQKNLSLLKGKLGEMVASECISVIDDPFLQNGTGTMAFDAEGVASSHKKLIDKGILSTYLHNLKSAKKDGVASTGNASRGSYKDTIGIAPSNLYIGKGMKTRDELMREMRSGLFITDLQGMHAGFNTISGDFSLSAKGYMVENGEKAGAVNQITVSGNFYTMMKSAVHAGDDMKLDMSGKIGSPSILFSGLSIAGE